MRKSILKFVAGVVAFALLAGGPALADEKEGHDHSHDHGHSHDAPHGGSLVGLGECFAHLEFVHVPEEGQVVMYVLDGDAQKGVRLETESIQAAVTVTEPEEKDAVKIELKPRANELTGEKAGDSSEFAGRAEALKTAKKVRGKVLKIEIKGQTFEDVEFVIPAEDHDDHGHDDDKKDAKADSGEKKDGHKH